MILSEMYCLMEQILIFSSPEYVCSTDQKDVSFSSSQHCSSSYNRPSNGSPALCLWTPVFIPSAMYLLSMFVFRKPYLYSCDFGMTFFFDHLEVWEEKKMVLARLANHKSEVFFYQ